MEYRNTRNTELHEIRTTLNTGLQGIQNYKEFRSTRNTELKGIQKYEEYETKCNTEIQKRMDFKKYRNTRKYKTKIMKCI